jgi:hypothetical protein
MDEIKAKAQEIHDRTISEVRAGHMSAITGREILRAAETILAAKQYG